MDDLLDLDWSKQPSAAKGNGAGAGMGTNGGSPAFQSAQAANSSSYNFDALTRSMPAGNRLNAGSPASRSYSASPMSGTPPLAPAAAKNGASTGDAFSSLLGPGSSFGSSSAATNSATMSMADRLKQQGQQSAFGGSASRHSPQQAQSSVSNDAAWAGLDDFMSAAPSKPTPAPSTTGSRASQANPKKDAGSWDFDFDSNSSKQSKQKATTTTTAPKASTPQDRKATPSKDPFDFSEFEDPADYQSSALGGDDRSATKQAQAPTNDAYAQNGSSRGNGKQGRTNFLDDSMEFDQQGDADEDDFEVLGELGRPARPLASAYRDSSYESKPAARPQQQRPPRAGTASPPPHIVGKVVEMGFSPQQAREALAQTTNGQDVAAAVEMLLKGSGGGGRRRGEDPRADDGQGHSEESDRQYAARLQQRERNAQRREPGQRGGGAAGHGGSSSDPSRTGTPVDWQKQADQLYAQASEMGASMFSKANALWASAKSQAQKALDEHGGSVGMPSSAQMSGRSSPASASGASERARNRRWAVPTRDGGAKQQREWQGKPKWMVDAEEDNDEEKDKGARGSAPSQGFRDDDDDEAVQEAPPFVDRKAAAAAAATQANTVAAEQRRAPPTDDTNLWSDDPASVQSTSKAKAAAPARATQRQGPQTVSSNRQAPSSGRAAQSTAARTNELRKRILQQEDPSAVRSSMQHKQRGNELFKRGAYGEAESAYTVALETLSTMPMSVRRVALFNNRANARMKNGDAKGTLDDTMAVLKLIVVQENERSSPFLLFRPSQEAPLPVPEYAEVNLREGYAKALLRRAQAEEMLERWDPAMSVWSLLEKYEREEGSGTSGVSNLRAAQEGRGRCDKMLKGGDMADDASKTAAAKAPPSNPRVRAAAAQAIAKAEAQAKERIRSENAAQAAEDAAKDQLRDSVDRRIVAWKTGKENNVRALLASLHDVVWPSLGWKRVGMHEVVMDNQVKKVYMRAIGKLHPDKLTPKNNSLEERMIGGAVFSVLNDAWAVAQAS